MQLVTAITSQRSLFEGPGLFTQEAITPTRAGDLQSASETPAAIPPASDAPARSPQPVDLTDTTPEPDRESLLGVYQSRLKAKRQRNASSGTVGDHETGLRHFDQFLAEIKADPQRCDRSAEPVASLASPEIVREFVDWLITSRENAAHTINRRLIALRMVSKVLKVDFERPTMSEIDRRIRELRPHGRTLKKSKREKLSVRADGTAMPARKIPSFEEIDALSRNVGVTRWPYGEHAPYFWRGWLRFLAFIGPRSRDIVSTVARKPGLRKQDVIWDSLCPIVDVNSAIGKPLHSPHGWLWYSIEKDHHSDCRKILIPMPLWMRNWIRFFYERSSHPERIFPAAQEGRRSLSQGAKTEAWDSIIAAAQVDPRLVESEGKAHAIAIRKYASNWWKLNVEQRTNNSKLAEKVAWYVLHHSEVTVSDKHYLSTQASVLPVMLELIPHWPIPAGDAPPVSLLPE